MDWLTEYLTVETLTLIVAIATLIVSCLAYRYNRRNNKTNIKREIAKKQAELNALNEMHYFTDSSTMGDAMVCRSVLHSEIEALKKML